MPSVPVSGRERLDLALVSRGLARSRARAQAEIKAGRVTVDGTVERTPSRLIDPLTAILIAEPENPWVSRGGLKLDHALDRFGLSPAGKVAIDVGASTGGFTQVLLTRGAARVYAIDVGRDQLDRRLTTHPRIVRRDGVNARELSDEHVPEPCGFATIDVSFISLTLVLAPIAARLGPGARLVALVKPQFEVGREAIGKGGIVRDADAAECAVGRIADHLAGLGFSEFGQIESPVPGGDGNREFLIAARAPS